MLLMHSTLTRQPQCIDNRRTEDESLVTGFPLFLYVLLTIWRCCCRLHCVSYMVCYTWAYYLANIENGNVVNSKHGTENMFLFQWEKKAQTQNLVGCVRFLFGACVWFICIFYVCIWCLWLCSQCRLYQFQSEWNMSNKDTKPPGTQYLLSPKKTPRKISVNVTNLSQQNCAHKHVLCNDV